MYVYGESFNQRILIRLYLTGEYEQGVKGAQAPNILIGTPCPHNFEPWHLLSKIANGKHTNLTHVHAYDVVKVMVFPINQVTCAQILYVKRLIIF